MGEFKGSESAAKYAAEHALRANNKNLKGLNAESAIPNGEVFTVKQSDLKKYLAPFKGRISDLRSVVANMSTGGMSKDQGKAIGKAFTPALGLPVDPNI